MVKPPNPGSKEAVDMGCLCPVMDNHSGKGFRQNADGGMLFWMVKDCPVHRMPDMRGPKDGED